MMTSNVLSRFRSPNADLATTSIYETLRLHEQDNDSDGSDIEARAGYEADEQNLTEHVNEFDDNEIGSSPESIRPSTSQAVLRAPINNKSKIGRSVLRPRWKQSGRSIRYPDDADDDVPASLLIEGDEGLPAKTSPTSASARKASRDASTGQADAKWQRAQTAQNLHPGQSMLSETRAPGLSTGLNFLVSADPKEKAMWRWVNVEVLDFHLHNVYFYYLNNGFWSIILTRIFFLLTSAFIVGFSIFLTQCIDYRHVKGSTKLSEIVVEHCTRRMGFTPNAILWLSTFWWVYKLATFISDLPRLYNLHNFYFHLLSVTEDEIQSISWQEIVSRIMSLRDAHPNIINPNTRQSRRMQHFHNKERLDAHDIANRLMRKDNYMVALVNKGILDMTLPLPWPFPRDRQLFTRNLEWNLEWTLFSWAFTSKNQVNEGFLDPANRRALSEALRRRFIVAGFVALVISPFQIVYRLIFEFFANFNTYQKNPSELSARQYNTWAQWKFREFNELIHLFERRLNMSQPFATRYVNQFPKDKTVQLARFVSFVSGAIVSVLFLATIFDQESFLSFEITPGRTTIFYLGVFGSIWAISHGLVPEENSVYDSEYSMEEVINFTHYKPVHWQGRLHTVEVKQEFEQLYQMRISILCEELLSMIFTPFVLWFSLTKCTDQIIDFFREFTVHVDGVGYVCSFAEFNFDRIGMPSNATAKRPGDGDAAEMRGDYFATKDQKLEQSYWGFMNDYAQNPKTDIHYRYRGPSWQGQQSRKFHMPPPFPGLLSPQVGPVQTGEPQHVAAARQSQNPSSPGKRRAGNHAGTTRLYGPHQASLSPMQSLLLDPHHQPQSSSLGLGSPQALRPSHMTNVTGKMRPRRTNLLNNESIIVEHPDQALPDDEELDVPPADLTSPTSPIRHLIQQSVQREAEGTIRESDSAKQSRVFEERSESQTTGMFHGSRDTADAGSWKLPDQDDADDTEDEQNIDVLTGERGVGVLGLVKQFQRVKDGLGQRTGT